MKEYLSYVLFLNNSLLGKDLTLLKFQIYGRQRIFLELQLLSSLGSFHACLPNKRLILLFDSDELIFV